MKENPLTLEVFIRLRSLSSDSFATECTIWVCDLSRDTDIPTDSSSFIVKPPVSLVQEHGEVRISMGAPLTSRSEAKELGIGMLDLILGVSLPRSQFIWDSVDPGPKTPDT